MIDFHTHILPNIDDGSRSIEETFALINEAKEVGFDKIILTSHYIEGYYETDTPEREVWLDAIYNNLKGKIDIDLYLGNEVYFSENMINLLEDGKASTINNTSYILFELPMNIEPINFFEIIHEMLQQKLVPILAHPERYAFVQEEPNLVFDLIDRGVLMQANYGSILGTYGEKAKFTVRKLLENNMIHFLGTDVHRPRTLYPKVNRAIEEIEEIVGQEILEELTTKNAELVLANKRITVREPEEVTLTLKEKIMLKLKK